MNKRGGSTAPLGSNVPLVCAFGDAIARLSGRPPQTVLTQGLVYNLMGFEMHLAYVTTTDRGATDRLLSEVAELLLDKGARLSGVVQTNTECADNSKCDMDLRVLPDGETIRISQSLGAHSRGCRLDPAALEQAVGYVTASLAEAPQLLIINKFGKHESDGRGFRPVIGEALALDIPVLVGVNGLNADKFKAFTGEEAEALEPNVDTILAWFDRIDTQSIAAA